LHVPGRRHPVPSLIEPPVGDLLDLVRRLLPPSLSPDFLDLVIKDAEQPGPQLRTPFETGHLFEESQEGGLRHIFRRGFVQAGGPGSPENLGEVLFHHGSLRVPVTLLNPADQLGSFWFHGPSPAGESYQQKR